MHKAYNYLAARGCAYWCYPMLLAWLEERQRSNEATERSSKQSDPISDRWVVFHSSSFSLPDTIRNDLQCVMMQGGYIEHCALPCHGARERITMVTSFRPKGKIVSDMSHLKTIRSCSNSFEVYDQVCFPPKIPPLVLHLLTSYLPVVRSKSSWYCPRGTRDLSRDFEEPSGDCRGCLRAKRRS